MKKNTLIKLGMFSFITASAVLAANSQKIVEAADNSTPATHIGTYDGSTTFTTSSANGVNPGLFIEVIDKDGNIAQYESEDGIITVENTRAGAYVTQAKLLGKTMYRDLDTGELLEAWEDGRNLELESSEMPVLTTVGKNLFDGTVIKSSIDVTTGEIFPNESSEWLATDYIDVKDIKSLYFQTGYMSNLNVVYMCFDSNKKFIGRNGFYNSLTGVINPLENTHYIRLRLHSTIDLSTTQIEQGTQVTSYEPYKTNILTVNEPVELRGVGEVQDTLDLMTGEYVQRIGEVKITDEMIDKFTIYKNFINNFSIVFDGLPEKKMVRFEFGKPIPMVSDKMVARLWSNGTMVENTVYFTQDNDGEMRIYHTPDWTLDEFKEWFRENKPTIQYQLATESIKTVGLTADGYFAPETSAQVSIKGETVPLIASITVPTETLSFVIDPNQEVDQQFIAPEFSVTNDTYAPLKLEIKSFEQLTNGMNDVLPSEHSDWTTLDKQESNDIALAVAPKPGAGWKTLIEGERYVADDSNYELGVINPAGTVEFGFSALHGPTITKPMNLQYTLGLIFDFE